MSEPSLLSWRCLADEPQVQGCHRKGIERSVQEGGEVVPKGVQRDRACFRKLVGYGSADLPEWGAWERSRSEQNMELADRVVVVTGGGNGIGEGMCRRFAAEGARVAVVDLDGDAAQRVAEEIGGLRFRADVANESDTQRVVTEVEDHLGPIDLYCANAGIGMEGGVETSDEEWQRIWEINFMSHVYVARAVLPGMLARGEGYLLHTASAAGLLTNFGAAAYSVTKHAVVALAEWLQITYGDQGLKVSALCPQFVFTGLLDDLLPAGMMSMANQVGLSPDQVAESVVEGLRAESFLILPHPEVSDYFAYKATDYDRWISGMTRLQGRLGIKAP